MHRISTVLIATVLLATLFTAAAQRIVISPQAIVVNPVPAFEVEVFVDRAPSGRSAPSYAIGESIELGVRVSEDAYVYLFSISARGEVVQILPNRFDDAGRNNFVREGQTRYFPPRGARYSYVIDPPEGLAKVIAVASKREIDTRTLARFETERDFQATSELGEEGFARALSIVVRPLPQQDWVTSTALYYVGRAPAQAAYGTLSIASSPSGAEVFVDGEFAGFTPLQWGERPGNVTVEVRRDGYETTTQRVQVRPGTTTDVRFDLRAVVRDGTVTFTSTPRGADVYVEGRFVGSTPTSRIAYAPGTYTARFELPGYGTESVRFTVRAGQASEVSQRLRVQEGSLEVTGNIGNAQVFLDGREAGRLASGSGRLVVDGLAPGSYELVVIAPGYSTFIGTVRIEAGRTTTQRVSQTRR
ncbi:MAG: PEGA domain-containing protein [Trueperaceae bacterium]|nr:MAG: PEGA domain-containing protein [Trueperaceae bacterium]